MGENPFGTLFVLVRTVEGTIKYTHSEGESGSVLRCETGRCDGDDAWKGRCARHGGEGVDE